MPELVVRRWTRYGKDRLYVNTPDGALVGWVDLVTGAEVVELPELGEEFRRAVLGHDPRLTAPHGAARERTASVVPATVPPPVDGLVEQTSPVASTDLAQNRPGQAVRQRAEEEWKAQRDRSVVVAGLARLLDARTDERSWRVGAKGEETVGGRLDRLREHGWHVLHAVPVGNRGSDIDHVLVGPGGVFTVNTKTHPGKPIWVGRNIVKVDGHSQPYLRNSRFEAERAARLLTAALGRPVGVRAMLVFATGWLGEPITVKQRPDDVGILEWSDVPRAFWRAPVLLTPDDVADIYAVARLAETWVGR